MSQSRGSKPKGALAILGAAAALTGLTAGTALADFPYARPGANESDYTDLYLTDQVPNDLCGDDNEFKYSASPDPDNDLNNARPTEVDGGVRGASVVDKEPPGDDCDNPPLQASEKPTAWRMTTGRPDVTIATLDSGIKWNDAGAMNDLRFKTRINRGEAPRPQGCSSYDCNGDGVFNLADYESDSRVTAVLGDSRRAGPPGVLTPQDVLIAFSDPAFSGDGKAGGRDDDGNGYVDDMVGWDFLDDDNDPYDDVQYGHGTGEARGSTSEADNGDTVGSCPNCMVIHMRVGDSFIADVNRFAAAVTYATDNDVQVVQSALGTLNNTTLARKAVDYAYRHGVTSILSAADEDAQHNNQPSLPHSILVNSVTQSPVPPPDQSYTAFNGCTNYNAKITLAIPSTSCSSDAVGVGSGLAGLIYSAAYTAVERGLLEPHPDRDACETVQAKRIGGQTDTACAITPNEVRQILASGRIGNEPQVDDINFLSPPDGGPEPSCSPAPAPQCTSPFGAGGTLIRAMVNANRPNLLGGPVASESYPARWGHDQFYGYGRANMVKAIGALLPDSGDSKMLPEAEIFSPEWYQQVDPNQDQIAVEGEVFARGAAYRCDVLVAPGQYPNQSDAPAGDFHSVGNGWCDGTTEHSGGDAAALHAGTLANIDVAELKGLFPPETQATGFSGPQPEARPETGNGRPAFAPNSFTYKVVVETTGTPALSGEDQRMSYLHRDQDMLPGFPRTASRPNQDGGSFPSGDGESSPAFADLDGDNRNELIYATSDGLLHAIRPNGSELPGWPVAGDVPGFVSSHSDAPGYAGGDVPVPEGGAFLAAVVVGDADRNGLLEVYAADLEGKVYGWDHEGRRIFTERSNPAYSGQPLEPFENVRQGKTNRTQPGFIGSPVLADLDEDGDQELVAASMDRHVYAWHLDDSGPGSPGGADPVDGFPVLVVDRDKVESVDPTTHRVRFRSDAQSFQQGGIIDTPALADLDEDGAPEIVVGTNEGYAEDPNTSIHTNPSFRIVAGTGLIDPGNTRLYVLDARGNRDDDPLSRDAIFDPDGDPATEEWPVPVAFLMGELLPIVGEGVTGYPVVGPANCLEGGEGPKVAAISYAGPGYVLNPDGSSCYGEDSEGKYRVLRTDQPVSSDTVDRPAIPTVGHPAFGDLGGTGPSVVIPAAGLQRALALVLPDNQPASQDFISAWDTSTGEFRPNFPQTQNDLSFLTGPSIADIDGAPGEEVVSGSASLDLNAYSAAGTAVPGWPKLTTDWTVANPAIGSFGTLDTEGSGTVNPLDGPRKVVIGMTRSGYVNAYSTEAPACSSGSWPRFHHDNANSGDYGRDATLPGKPMGLTVTNGEVLFESPGDDLLCGTADAYELVTSDSPIDERNFDDATPLEGAPEPEEAGTEQSFEVPAGARRYLAIRAVDDQGNVGRVASVDLRAGGAGPGGPGDGGGPGTGPGSAGPDENGPTGRCSTLHPGTNGRDTLRGDDDSERIKAGGGRDKVKAGRGDDCVAGGGGRDKIAGQGGEDRIGGGKGADRLRGNGGGDRITGGTQPDRIDGGGGKDLIRGAGDGKRDRIHCGGGRDTVIADGKDKVRPSCERVK